jgi:dUTP pyrophosphatase
MGHEIQVRPKSGLALKEGLTVLNTPGTVDAGYDGEVKVIIYNTNPQSYQIKKGQKIAQAVLCPVINGKFVTLHEVIELNEKERGSNGFGSTGI